MGIIFNIKYKINFIYKLSNQGHCACFTDPKRYQVVQLLILLHYLLYIHLIGIAPLVALTKVCAAVSWNVPTFNVIVVAVTPCICNFFSKLHQHPAFTPVPLLGIAMSCVSITGYK